MPCLTTVADARLLLATNVLGCQRDLMSMYRREARVFLREEIMVDENAREITYLRDLGLSGHRTGPSTDELLKKELKKLGVEVVSEATEEDLEKAWQGVIGSSKRTNPDATAAATAGTPAKPGGK